MGVLPGGVQIDKQRAEERRRGDDVALVAQFRPVEDAAQKRQQKGKAGPRHGCPDKGKRGIKVKVDGRHDQE